MAEVDSPRPTKEDPVSVRYASPSYDDRFERRPSFRRRYGRGGRLFIDRRQMNAASVRDTEMIDDVVLDRIKFDCDDSDDDQTPVYLVNPDSDDSIWFRAKVAYEAERAQMMRQAREREKLAQQQQANDAERAHAMVSNDHR